MAWNDDQRRRTYQCWQDMKTRCYNERSHNFKNYGARGIAVCDRWLASFDNFVADMGIKPEGLTLERMNNDLGYGPDNFRWATRAEQRANQRTCTYLEFNGERRTVRDWAHHLGMPEQTLHSRLNLNGWPIEKALTTPVDQRYSANGKKGLYVRFAAIAANQARKGE